MAVVSQDQIVLNVLLDDFNNYLQHQKYCADNTIMEYQRTVRDLLIFLKRERKVKDLNDVSLKDMRAFMGILHEQGNTFSSQITKLMRIRTFFSYLHTDSIIKAELYENIREQFKGKREIVLTQTELTIEEEAKLLSATSKTRKPERNWLILKIMVESGFRVSELISITPKMTSPDLSITPDSRKGKKSKLQIGFGLITEGTFQVLDSYILNHGIESDERIFDITRQAVWYMIKGLASLSNITKIVSPHTYRHTWASRFYKATRDVQALKLLGGWLSNCYERYTHLDMEYLKEQHAKAFS
jgi:integrase/recombinase XerD